MASRGTITFYDFRQRPTSMTINMDDLTGAGYDIEEGDLADLEAALAAISLSDRHARTNSGQTEVGGPEDAGGVRGNKALVRWYSAAEGDGGQYGTNEIGTVDPDLFTVVGDKAILQGALYDAIKTAFDAAAFTENGNGVSVYEIEFVSRNL